MARAQVGSLARALTVLQQFTQARPEWGVAELAEALHASKGTVSKILATFLQYGYVTQDPLTRRYRLGPSMLAGGQVAAASMDVSKVALPVLREVTAATSETSIFMLRAGWRSVCAAKVDSPQPVRMAADVGRYASLHSGASNKPILAFMTDPEIDEYVASPYFVPRGPRSITDPDRLRAHLADIRAQGVAESESEVESDIHAVGAPVFDMHGVVAGAVSVAGPASRLRARYPEDTRDLIRAAARELTRRLGWQGEWPPSERRAPAGRTRKGGELGKSRFASSHQVP